MEKEFDKNKIPKSFDKLQADQMSPRSNLFTQRYMVDDTFTTFYDTFSSDRNKFVAGLKAKLLLTFSDTEDSSNSDDNFKANKFMAGLKATLLLSLSDRKDSSNSDDNFKANKSDTHIPGKASLFDILQLDLNNENSHQHNNSLDNQQKGTDDGPCMQKSSADTAASNSTKKLDINATLIVQQSNLNINAMEFIPSKIFQKAMDNVRENDGNHLGKVKSSAQQQNLPRYFDPTMERPIEMQNQLQYAFPYYRVEVENDCHYFYPYPLYSEQYYEDENPQLNHFEFSNRCETDLTVDQVDCLQNNFTFGIGSEQHHNPYEDWEKIGFVIDLYHIPKNYSTDSPSCIYREKLLVPGSSDEGKATSQFMHVINALLQGHSTLTPNK